MPDLATDDANGDASVARQPVVLFVDDEASILSALRRLFRPQGYKLLLAEGGAIGLAIMEREPVDLVISDMRMPEMDGVQFLEQVRQRWPDVVRVLLTGYSDISSTIGAINRGEIHRYIAKPWDDQDILLSVSDGLKRHALEQENRRLNALTQAQNQELQDVNAQVQAANEQLKQLNAQLEQANEQLQGLNHVLEERVQARTADLEQANEKLAATNAEMEVANAKLNAANTQLEENFALSISVFSGLLELRDGSVSGHGHRVADLSRRIAQKMALDEREVLDIYNAGLLHEVGKIGLPDHLLRKTVSLMTGEEFSRYKLHPQQAQAALMPLGRLRQSAVLIRSHHERVDGHGFPDGLAGMEVPLGSQIISVASIYESLITGRLAEKVFSTEAAATALREGSGTRHDAEVIAAFDAVLNDLAAEANADIELQVHELKPGMVLARDLLSPHGSLLLPTGFKFSNPVIKQITEFHERDNLDLSFFIKKASAPGVVPAARADKPSAGAQNRAEVHP